MEARDRRATLDGIPDREDPGCPAPMAVEQRALDALELLVSFLVARIDQHQATPLRGWQQSTQGSIAVFATNTHIRMSCHCARQRAPFCRLHLEQYRPVSGSDQFGGEQRRPRVTLQPARLRVAAQT